MCKRAIARSKNFFNKAGKRPLKNVKNDWAGKSGVVLGPGGQANGSVTLNCPWLCSVLGTGNVWEHLHTYWPNIAINIIGRHWHSNFGSKQAFIYFFLFICLFIVFIVFILFILAKSHLFKNFILIELKTRNFN